MIDEEGLIAARFSLDSCGFRCSRFHGFYVWESSYINGVLTSSTTVFYGSCFSDNIHSDWFLSAAGVNKMRMFELVSKFCVNFL